MCFFPDSCFHAVADGFNFASSGVVWMRGEAALQPHETSPVMTIVGEPLVGQTASGITKFLFVSEKNWGV